MSDKITVDGLAKYEGGFWHFICEDLPLYVRDISYECGLSRMLKLLEDEASNSMEEVGVLGSARRSTPKETIDLFCHRAFDHSQPRAPVKRWKLSISSDRS